MNILLVDDDPIIRGNIKKLLLDLHNNVDECRDGEAALDYYTRYNYDLVLADINLPKFSGLQFLKYAKNITKKIEPAIVLFTGFASIESAIEAMKAGAFDYLVKPVTKEKLLAVLARVEAEQAKAIPDSLAKVGRAFYHIKEGKQIAMFSEKMQNIYEQARKYNMDRSMPILIQGETGTGKDVIAWVIHSGGGDSHRPFVDINCAAITPSLFESELFGYEAGSFTGGAVRGKSGKFDLANNGTLFFDEVGELPLDLQGKLLRVLESKEFYRVGGVTKIKSDVRIICATNVNLAKAVAEGHFRQDLYYRLKVGQLYIPPLRERKEDILPLAQLFLKEIAREKGKRFEKISDAAGQLLISREWKGNVRELRNVIEWSVFMYDDEVLKLEHVESNPEEKFFIDEVTDVISDDIIATLDEQVVRAVQRALRANNGNKAATARALNISRSSLYRIMERLGSELDQLN